ncbi:hypothetical protein JZ751_020147 [Albula glossodonta]|uniref:Wiskott-Aldrich syndrome protein family member n=1 Tax=Albula glossodonta TaxID=121402 RepID=A0A8T2NLN3_9TELE|nr:hypothetical protein JZ751_020147 [Albula glossodonta]
MTSLTPTDRARHGTVQYLGVPWVPKRAKRVAMPLVKRSIEPRHLCRGALPEGVTSELECVTNSTLAAIIKQLGSLSRHAEDIFGELFNEANSFYMRMNSLQERVDLLAVKVTQLDSTVEEGDSGSRVMTGAHCMLKLNGVAIVTLLSCLAKLLVVMMAGGGQGSDQRNLPLLPSALFTCSVEILDINMRKAFKSSTTQDQQVVSRNSIPNPTSGPAHTDPARPQSRQATHRSPLSSSEQKQVEDPTREVKKVRKARNRRQEWNMMAYDKEFRPDTRFTPSPYHGMSSEGSLSPDNRSVASDVGELSYPASPNHPSQQVSGSSAYSAAEGKELRTAPSQTQSLDRVYRPPPAAAGRQAHSLGRAQPPHAPPPTADPALNGPRPQAVKDYRSTAFDSPAVPPSLPPSTAAAVSRPYSPSPPPPAPPVNYVPSPSHPPAGGPPMAPPPPPPGPPTHTLSPAHAAVAPPPSGEAPPRKGQVPLIPMSDARSDLLAAIRRGIQLRKVQEQREQEAKKEPVGNDVATILSRRIAVEYSESDDDSELDENELLDRFRAVGQPRRLTSERVQVTHSTAEVSNAASEHPPAARRSICPANTRHATTRPAYRQLLSTRSPDKHADVCLPSVARSSPARPLSGFS